MEVKYYDFLHKDAMFIREEVFMKEQGFKDEFDDLDEKSQHVVIYIEEKPVATGRTFLVDDTYHLGRIAVLKEYRKLHLGSVIIESLENKIKELNGSKMELSSQLQAKGFYEKQGFTPVGDIYLDEHCEHIRMIKEV